VDGIITSCNVARSLHWFARWLHHAIWHVARSGIMRVNSPSGNTLQCDTWLWDDMPWNLPKCPPFWNFTSGFDFDYIAAVDMSVCEILSKSDHHQQKKMTSCRRFSRWRISTILDFRGPIMGSLKSRCTTSYRSSIETIAAFRLPHGKNRKHSAM